MSDRTIASAIAAALLAESVNTGKPVMFPSIGVVLYDTKTTPREVVEEAIRKCIQSQRYYISSFAKTPDDVLKHEAQIRLLEEELASLDEVYPPVGNT